jgi:hypothetical protein
MIAAGKAEGLFTCISSGGQLWMGAAAYPEVCLARLYHSGGLLKPAHGLGIR